MADITKLIEKLDGEKEHLKAQLAKKAQIADEYRQMEQAVKSGQARLVALEALFGDINSEEISQRIADIDAVMEEFEIPKKEGESK